MGKPDKDGQGTSWGDPSQPSPQTLHKIKTEEDGKTDEEERELTVVGEIFFHTAEWELDETNDKPALNAIAKYYEPYLDSDTRLTFYLFGHADYRGNDEYNINLSNDRAGKVRDYLQNYGKFKNAKNCTYVVIPVGETESYQPSKANRGPKPNILNLLQEDRRVEVCAECLIEQRWRATITGREIWDQELSKEVLVEKHIFRKDDIKWVYVYDGIEVHYRYVVEFTVAKEKEYSPWFYKEGRIVEVTPGIVNNIKKENDYLRGHELGKNLKDIVFEDPKWGDKIKGQRIDGKMVEDEYLLRRLYTPHKSDILSSVPKRKGIDLEFRNYDGIEYELTPGENPGDYKKIPHVSLAWPYHRMTPHLCLLFDNKEKLPIRQRDHNELIDPVWAVYLRDQLIPLKAGGRQFEHISSHPLYSPDHTDRPFMTIYYEQRVERL